MDLPFTVIGGFWEKYLVCPKGSRITFASARDEFVKIISSLFGVEPGAVVSRADLDFFSSSNRNLIMEAGREKKMVRMMYRGLERVIEPYSLKYKIRRDRVGREYLYAWDITGGSSGQFSIKTYTQDGIQDMTLTDQPFTPRYPIELSRAGELDSDPYFTSSRTTTRRVARRGTGRRRRTPAFLSPESYTIMCPMCMKEFRRTSMNSTKLNKHKNTWGSPCPGRVGHFV